MDMPIAKKRRRKKKTSQLEGNANLPPESDPTVELPFSCTSSN